MDIFPLGETFFHLFICLIDPGFINSSKILVDGEDFTLLILIKKNLPFYEIFNGLENMDVSRI